MTVRPLRPLALLLAGALVLTGCAGGGASPAEPTGEPTDEQSAPPENGEVTGAEASGAFGEAPEFTFSSETPPEGLQVEVLSEGDGAVVEPDAYVLAHYAGIVWGAEETFDDSYSREAPSMFPLSGVVQGWTEGIPEHAIGSRLLMSIPADLGYGPQGGNPNAGIGPDDTIVFVVDLVGAYDAEQTGQADATEVTPAEELAVTVNGALGEPASIAVPEGATEPGEVATIVLAEGSGEAVAAGDTVVVGFAGTTWDGASAGSSWTVDGTPGSGPFSNVVGRGSIVDAVVDVPVGSRVLVLAPAGDGAPASAYVVDVLGAA
ncbi:FKBP-type peptidyl-prolyl cis-trans isomerase [Ruania halotolerans]|uniref:FKBP-type peptidyl-prolyl cis-trans isomerase n=1 Tax=Ruania halotolerans TaxID=2897773 RepID=UPI001E38C448|nr:FKBP-type peptidyl-prolyl cis-trans isomerase [Ruania halotolerans]UFU04839.1 FKBP-type peptidyl-prolyl cis-trans isomerase [Ruania halotolerans]